MSIVRPPLLHEAIQHENPCTRVQVAAVVRRMHGGALRASSALYSTEHLSPRAQACPTLPPRPIDPRIHPKARYATPGRERRSWAEGLKCSVLYKHLGPSALYPCGVGYGGVPHGLAGHNLRITYT